MTTGDRLFVRLTFLSAAYMVVMYLYSLELGQFVLSPW